MAKISANGCTEVLKWRIISTNTECLLRSDGVILVKWSKSDEWEKLSRIPVSKISDKIRQVRYEEVGFFEVIP